MPLPKKIQNGWKTYKFIDLLGKCGPTSSGSVFRFCWILHDLFLIFLYGFIWFSYDFICILYDFILFCMVLIIIIITIIIIILIIIIVIIILEVVPHFSSDPLF